MGINFKYGGDFFFGGVLWSSEVQGAYVVGLWKNIRRRGGVFSRRIRLIVGSGSKIKFWHDIWCGDHFFLMHYFYGKKLLTSIVLISIIPLYLFLSLNWLYSLVYFICT